MEINGNIGNNSNEKNEPLSNQCMNCRKIYKTLSGLWKHNKVCKIGYQKVTTVETPMLENKTNNKNL